MSSTDQFQCSCALLRPVAASDIARTFLYAWEIGPTAEASKWLADMNALGPLCSSSPSSSPSVSPRSSTSSHAATARRRSPDSRSCSVCSVSCCCRPYSRRRPGRRFNKPAFTTPQHTPLARESIKYVFTFAPDLRDAVKRPFLFSHDERERQGLAAIIERARVAITVDVRRRWSEISSLAANHKACIDYIVFKAGNTHSCIKHDT